MEIQGLKKVRNASRLKRDRPGDRAELAGCQGRLTLQTIPTCVRQSRGLVCVCVCVQTVLSVAPPPPALQMSINRLQLLLWLVVLHTVAFEGELGDED